MGGLAVGRDGESEHSIMVGSKLRLELRLVEWLPAELSVPVFMKLRPGVLAACVGEKACSKCVRVSALSKHERLLECRLQSVDNSVGVE